MLLAYHTLAEDLELVAEQRLRKTLAPDLLFEELREAQIEIRGLERPVGLDRATELRGRQPFAGHGFEEFREARKVFYMQRCSGGGRVPPEAQQQPGSELREEIIGLEPHVRLDRAPLVVELVELPRDVQGAPAVRSDEALDPEAHVGKAPGGVQPRRKQEPQIEGAGARRIASGDGEERAHAFPHSARAYAPQPLSDQHAVVEIVSLNDAAPAE